MHLTPVKTSYHPTFQALVGKKSQTCPHRPAVDTLLKQPSSQDNMPFSQTFSGLLAKISFAGLCKELKNVVKTCAYCGGEIYTEQEITTMAAKLLPQKGQQLQQSLKDLLSKLSQPAKAGQSLVRDKNETHLKKRILILEKMIKLSQKQPASTLEQLIQNHKRELRLSPGKLEKKTPQQVMEFLFYPLIQSIDHFEPKIKGGSSSIKNYYNSCLGCNNLKSAMDPAEFLRCYPEVIQNISSWQRQYDKLTRK